MPGTITHDIINHPDDLTVSWAQRIVDQHALGAKVSGVTVTDIPHSLASI